MQSPPVTHRIYATALELLDAHQEGLRWSELLAQIQASDPGFHPKTVNGCVWKLVERFPERVYKPAKGLFRLVKYKSAEAGDPQRSSGGSHRGVPEDTEDGNGYGKA